MKNIGQELDGPALKLSKVISAAMKSWHDVRRSARQRLHPHEDMPRGVGAHQMEAAISLADRLGAMGALHPAFQVYVWAHDVSGTHSATRSDMKRKMAESMLKMQASGDLGARRTARFFSRHFYHRAAEEFEVKKLLGIASAA